MITDATFTSVWDDGAVSFDSNCGVDFDEMRIVAMEAPHMAWDEEGSPVYDEDEIDALANDVSVLDEQYVELPDGIRYTVASGDDYYEAEDKYGHGVVYGYE